MTRAVLLTVEGVARVIEVEPTLVGIYAALGAEGIEGVRIDSENHGYIDDEGKFEGKAVNPVATSLLHALGTLDPRDFIAGDLLILGRNGSGEGDVTGRWVHWARRMGAMADRLNGNIVTP